MDLKNKFNDYETEPDELAWEHFQLLRRNKKSKKRFFWWFFTGFGLLVITSGIIYFQSRSNSIDSQKNISVTERGIEHSYTISEKNKTKLLQNPIKKVESIIEFKEEKALINTSRETKNTPIRIKPEFEKIVNKNKAIKAENRPVNSRKITREIIGNQNPVEEEIFNKKSELLSIVKIEESISLLTTLESLNINPLEIKNRLVDLDILNIPASLTKPLSERTNMFKIGWNHADAFVNGFSTENPVDKRGFAIQMEYYHEWNKIIGTGISAGYIKMIDKENPNFIIKDKEVIKFLHANLYLFLVNENKHKLLVKVGGGFTNTDRILAGFLIRPNEPIARIFQANKFTSFGYLVEGAYEFKVSPRYTIGANYSIIGHNDGGWYSGISLGYSF